MRSIGPAGFKCFCSIISNKRQTLFRIRLSHNITGTAHAYQENNCQGQSIKDIILSHKRSLSWWIFNGMRLKEFPGIETIYLSLNVEKILLKQEWIYPYRN